MIRTAESVFRELNARLDIPARRRAELLRELRGDFEDLVSTLVAEGLSPEAAQAHALELLAPTSGDAGALAGIHRPAYARLVERLRPGRVRLVERVGIGAMASLAVLAPVLALARGSLLPVPTLAALGFVALLLVANLAWQAFRIVVRDDADAESLSRAGAIQGALVALALTVGALTMVAQAYMATGAWQASGDVNVAGLATTCIRCAEAAALTVGLTILGVFGAVALLQWRVAARGIEEELDELLQPVFSFPEE